MKSGKMRDARHQVCRTFRSFRLFMPRTRGRSRGWTNGPFLTDRDISGSSLALAMPAADDQAIRRLTTTRPVSHRGLAPRRLRGHARGGLALAATVRVIPRRHRDAPDLRTLAHVAGAPGLAGVLVLMIQVGDLPDGRDAPHGHAAHLARREPDGGEVAFLGEQ